jgi:murein DD-endopeptidase MepM/ murein hydrolase activator NlpD
MKLLTIVIAFLFSIASYAQEADVKVYYEPDADNNLVVYADNNEYCPVSVEVEFTLKNYKSTKDEKFVFVVPPKSSRNVMTTLSVVNKKKATGFSFNTVFDFGDFTLKEYDKDFKYYLPFSKGEAYIVGQGYNGSFSHRKENSLDFDMPIGTEVRAVRGGLVVAIVQKNSKHCTQLECQKYNNYVLIYHSDGTFAQYTHIKKKGAMVEVGAEVKIGDLVALSGNVGYSSGPHLHFNVFVSNAAGRTTIETKFLTKTGSSTEILQEKEEYKREY